MTILDQRVGTRRTEAAAERGQFVRAEILIAEHQHRIFSKCLLDPGEGRLIEWFAMGQTAAAVHGSSAGTVVEIDDLRYGFPSRPREGLWGIRARFDAAGHIEGRPERIDRPLPAPVWALVGQIFRETFPQGP